VREFEVLAPVQAIRLESAEMKEGTRPATGVVMVLTCQTPLDESAAWPEELRPSVRTIARLAIIAGTNLFLLTAHPQNRCRLVFLWLPLSRPCACWVNSWRHKT